MKKKVIWYKGFGYNHPRKKKKNRIIWKPIIVTIKEKEENED